MLKRILLLLPVGALALSATPATAGSFGYGCGGCGPHHPRPVQSCGGGFFGGGFFGGGYGGGYSCPVVVQPVPVYVVNQGPVYSGPGLSDPRYGTWYAPRAVGAYPYVSGRPGYYGHRRAYYGHRYHHRYHRPISVYN